jgi:hypothetical protein
MAASMLYNDWIVNVTAVMKAKKARRLNPRLATLAGRPFQQNVDRRAITDQFDVDAAMWYGAIDTGPYSFLLRQLFHTLYQAGVLYRNGTQWLDWAANPLFNVAALLSHGQRVLIQIPDQNHGGDLFWTWLNRVEKIPPRGYATHGLSLVSNPKVLAEGHTQYVREEHGNWQSLKGHVQSRHYGFNIALGGLGNRNPFSPTNDDSKFEFEPVKADGRNGHVYINYLPPTKKEQGGMLVGCENAQHGAGSNPHTGAGHGLGTPQAISACGGKKWSALKNEPTKGPTEGYNGMICDLTDRGRDLTWLLKPSLFDPNYLDGSTLPVAKLS